MEAFSNLEILPEDLPQANALEFTPLEPIALNIWRLNIGLFFGGLFLIEALTFYFVSDLRLPWLMISLSVFTLLWLVLAFLDLHYSFRWSGYALRERDLLYRSGWLRRRVRSVPISRVQHLSVVSGWLERRYGLASLRIYTAAQSDFSIKGIKRERAESLKVWISQKVDIEEKQTPDSTNQEKEENDKH